MRILSALILLNMLQSSTRLAAAFGGGGAGRYRRARGAQQRPRAGAGPQAPSAPFPQARVPPGSVRKQHGVSKERGLYGDLRA